MISVIAEHSVDLDLLPPKATCLDLGCRSFTWTKAMRDLGHMVYPIDIDKIEGGAYYQCGISDYNGYCGVKHYDDAQATTIMEGIEIKCYTLEQFSKDVGVKWFDLIKLDIEGAEREVIMSLTKPLATQLSIEFHVFRQSYTKEDVEIMVSKLESLGYETVQHVWESRHGAGFSYWDSLMILK